MARCRNGYARECQSDRVVILGTGLVHVRLQVAVSHYNLWVRVGWQNALHADL